MATKFVQPGSVIDCTAPVGGVVSGMPVLIGDVLVVPLNTAAAGVKFAGQVAGVWKIAKPAGAILELAVLYWDNAAFKATGTSTGNRKIGSAAKAAANGDAEVHVRLDGIVAEAATEAAAGAAVAAAVAATNGGAGNASKLIKLDGAGKLAGRVIETDGASLDATVIVANAALPKAGGQMSGNLTFAGAQTVDGRDVSADGTALDATIIVANAALPKAGGQISGNVTCVGAQTFDGRDLSVDGTKLDGIAAGAAGQLTIPNGSTNATVAAPAGWANGMRVVASILTKGANSVSLVEAKVAAGLLDATVSADPGAGGCVIQFLNVHGA